MDTATVEAADRLAQEMKSWKSIEFRSHEILANDRAKNDPDMFASLKTVIHYIETASGQRFLEDQMLPDRGRETTSIYYCDGKKSADFFPRTNVSNEEFDHVLIKRDFNMEATTGSHGAPEPLFYYYFGLRPLYEDLKTADSLGVDSHLGRDCDVFLIRDIKGNAAACTVFVLDRVHAIPLKVRHYINEEARTSARPTSAWNAVAVEEMEGHLFPMKSEQFYYSTVAPFQAVSQRSIVVDEVHFNRSYPASSFWPKIGSETQVTDAIKKTFTSPKSAKPAPSQTTEATVSPIQAVETEGWGSMIPSASLGLGLVLLSAGVVLWWRRRSAGSRSA